MRLRSLPLYMLGGAVVGTVLAITSMDGALPTHILIISGATVGALSGAVLYLVDRKRGGG